MLVGHVVMSRALLPFFVSAGFLLNFALLFTLHNKLLKSQCLLLKKAATAASLTTFTGT